MAVKFTVRATVVVGLISLIWLSGCTEEAKSPWHLETVDGGCNVVHTSLALDSRGYPHISYQDLDFGLEDHAKAFGKVESRGCADGAVGDVAQARTFAVDHAVPGGCRSRVEPEHAHLSPHGRGHVLFGDVEVRVDALHIVELLQPIQESQGVERRLLVKHHRIGGHHRYLSRDHCQVLLL